MSELFAKEGQSIFCFRPGDILIRLKPCIINVPQYNDTLGISVQVETRRDESYRRQPARLIGIYNNLIYLDPMQSYSRVSALPIEHYELDWALFEVPQGMTLDDCLR